MRVPWDYYQTEYKQDAPSDIPELDWGYWETHAREYVDSVCMRRISGMEELPHYVKHAVCAIADAMFMHTRDSAAVKGSDGSGILAVAPQGVTVVKAGSGLNALQTEDLLGKQKHRILQNYLSMRTTEDGTPLLSRGVA